MNLQGMKARADQEINERLKVLDSLQTQIGKDKYLSSSDKALLTGEIATEITGLTKLKAQVDAETSVKALQSDLQSIYDTYRVYAIERPKADLLRGSDLILWYCGNKLNNLPNLISTTTSKMSLDADTTAKVNGLLADAQSQAKTACSDAQAAHDEAAGLTPSGYPGNQATLKDAYGKLKDAHKALEQASADYRQIVQILKSKQPVPSPKPSVSPPPRPSVGSVPHLTSPTEGGGSPQR